RSLYHIGRTYMELDDAARAEDFLSRSLKSALDVNARDTVVYNYSALGTLYIDAGRYDKAKESSRQCLQTAILPKGSPAWLGHFAEASAYANLGNIAAWEGDNDGALEYLKKSMDLSNGLNIPGVAASSSVADRLFDIGWVYYTTGDYAKALESYTKAEAISRENQYIGGLARALNGIGVLYLDQGDYPKALDFLKRTVDTATSANRRRLATAALSNIALAHQRLGDHEKAALYFRQALESAKAMGAEELVIA